MANFQFPDPADQTTVINPETGTTYRWLADPGKWVVTGEQTELVGNYVQRQGGDEMEGPLKISGPRTAGEDPDHPDITSSLEVLSIDNTQDSSLELRYDGNTKVYIDSDDVAIASDIKINRPQGSVVKTNVQDLLNIGEREVAYLGQSIEDEDLVTKKYVDDADDVLRQDIIELEEELEALAPSLERGEWLFNPTGSAGVGQFALFAAGTPTSEFPQADTLFINSVDTSSALHNFTDVTVDSYVEIFSETDADFGLYQIKVIHDESEGANSFWHFEIEHIRSNRPLADAEAICRFKFFELSEGADASTFVLKSGDTMTGRLTINQPRKDVNSIVFSIAGQIRNNSNAIVDDILLKSYQRLNGSNQSDYIVYYGSGGGDYEILNRKAGDLRFVNKTGDEMSGDLQFNTTQTTYSSDPADATAKIVFENKKNNSVTKTVQLFQPGDDNSLVIDGTLRFKNDLRVGGTITNWRDNEQNISNRNAFIKLGTNSDPNNKTGVLGFTDNTDVKCLEWDLYHGVNIPLPGFSGNTSGFRVLGKIGAHYSDTAYTSTSNLLHTYHKSGETDEINYYGRIIGPKNLTTKEYVDQGISDTKEYVDQAISAGGNKLVPVVDITGTTVPQLNWDGSSTGFNRDDGYYPVNENGGRTLNDYGYGVWISDALMDRTVLKNHSGNFISAMLLPLDNLSNARFTFYTNNTIYYQPVGELYRKEIGGNKGWVIIWSPSQSKRLSGGVNQMMFDSMFTSYGSAGYLPIDDTEVTTMTENLVQNVSVVIGAATSSVTEDYVYAVNSSGQTTGASYYGLFVPYKVFITNNNALNSVVTFNRGFKFDAAQVGKIKNSGSTSYDRTPTKVFHNHVINNVEGVWFQWANYVSATSSSYRGWDFDITDGVSYSIATAKPGAGLDHSIPDNPAPGS